MWRSSKINFKISMNSQQQKSTEKGQEKIQSIIAQEQALIKQVDDLTNIHDSARKNQQLLSEKFRQIHAEIDKLRLQKDALTKRLEEIENEINAKYEESKEALAQSQKSLSEASSFQMALTIAEDELEQFREEHFWLEGIRSELEKVTLVKREKVLAKPESPKPKRKTFTMPQVAVFLAVTRLKEMEDAGQITTQYSEDQDTRGFICRLKVQSRLDYVQTIYAMAYGTNKKTAKNIVASMVTTFWEKYPFMKDLTVCGDVELNPGPADFYQQQWEAECLNRQKMYNKRHARQKGKKRITMKTKYVKLFEDEKSQQNIGYSGDFNNDMVALHEHMISHGYLSNRFEKVTPELIRSAVRRYIKGFGLTDFNYLVRKTLKAEKEGKILLSLKVNKSPSPQPGEKVRAYLVKMYPYIYDNKLAEVFKGMYNVHVSSQSSNNPDQSWYQKAMGTVKTKAAGMVKEGAVTEIKDQIGGFFRTAIDTATKYLKQIGSQLVKYKSFIVTIAVGILIGIFGAAVISRYSQYIFTNAYYEWNPQPTEEDLYKVPLEQTEEMKKIIETNKRVQEIAEKIDKAIEKKEEPKPEKEEPKPEKPIEEATEEKEEQWGDFLSRWTFWSRLGTWSAASWFAGAGLTTASVAAMVRSKDWRNKLIEWGRLVDSVTKIGKFITVVTDMFKWLIDWSCRSLTGSSWFKSTRDIELIHDKLKDLENTLYLKTTADFTRPEKVAYNKAYEELIFIGREINKTKDQSLISKVALMKTKAHEKYEIFKNQLSTERVRQPPVVVWLQSGPAGGKSTLTKFIAQSVFSYLLKHHPEKVSDWQADEWKEDLLYPRNASQEYWDGYGKQFVVTIDDIFKRLDESARALEGEEIIGMANTAPYPLHMAELQLKASTYFTSPLLVCSSNLMDDKLIKVGMTDVNALKRRRDFVVTCSLKKGTRQVDAYHVANLENYILEVATVNQESYKLEEQFAGTGTTVFMKLIRAIVKKYLENWQQAQTQSKPIDFGDLFERDFNQDEKDKKAQEEDEKVRKQRKVVINKEKKQLFIKQNPQEDAKEKSEHSSYSTSYSDSDEDNISGTEKVNEVDEPEFRKSYKMLYAREWDPSSDVRSYDALNEGYAEAIKLYEDLYKKPWDEKTPLDYDYLVAKNVHKEKVTKKGFSFPKKTWIPKDTAAPASSTSSTSDKKDEVKSQGYFMSKTVKFQAMYADEIVEPIYQFNNCPSYHPTLVWQKTMVELTGSNNYGAWLEWRKKAPTDFPYNYFDMGTTKMMYNLSKIDKGTLFNKWHEYLEQYVKEQGAKSIFIEAKIREMFKDKSLSEDEIQLFSQPLQLKAYHIRQRTDYWEMCTRISKEIRPIVFSEHLSSIQKFVGIETTFTNLIQSDFDLTPTKDVNPLATYLMYAAAFMASMVIGYKVMMFVFDYFKSDDINTERIVEFTSDSGDKFQKNLQRAVFKKRAVKVIKSQLLDINGDDQGKRVVANTRFAVFHYLNGEVAHGWVLGLKQNTYAMASHYLNDPISHISLHPDPSKLDHNTTLVEWSKTYHKIWRQKDLCLFVAPDLPYVKDIVDRHAWSKTNILGKGSLLGFSRWEKNVVGGETVIRLLESTGYSRFYQAKDSDVDFTANAVVENGKKVPLDGIFLVPGLVGVNGDCGQGIVCKNPSVQKKFIGIHIGSTDREGVVSPIFLEDIADVEKEAFDYFHIKNEAQSQWLKWSETDPYLPPSSGLKIEEDGGCYMGLPCDGKFNKKFSWPTKTQMMPTPLVTGMDTFIAGKPVHLDPPFEVKTAPALLYSEDKDIVSLALRGLQGKMLTNRGIMKSQDFRGIFTPGLKDMKFVFLTLKECCLGITEWGNVHATERKTSGAFPFVLQQKSKEQLIIPEHDKSNVLDVDPLDWVLGLGREPQLSDFKEVNKPGLWVDPEVQLMFYLRFYLAHHYKILPDITLICLKDEPRPLERVKLGYTRAFQIGELSHSLYSKSVFGEMISMVENLMEGDILLGINPYSRQWSTIMYELHSVSPRLFDPDGSKWDIRYCTSEYMRARHQAAHEFFGLPYEHKYMKQSFAVVYSTLNPRIVIRDKVYRAPIMPSGCLLTAYLNSEYHSSLDRTIFRVIVPEHDFDDKTKNKVYSDDGLQALPKEDDIFERYNGRTIAAASIKYFNLERTVGESKTTDVPLSRTEEDVALLKRGFVLDNGVWLAPLSEDSLISSLQWITKPKDKTFAQQFKVNCYNALQEYSLHGKEKFEKMKKILNAFLIGYNPAFAYTRTYEEVRREMVDAAI